jgi:hypothetical protein
MKYRLKRMVLTQDENGNTNAPDIRDRQIVKTGHEDVFTMSQVDQNKAHYTKTRKELVAQKEIEAAKMFNVEEFHPFVKEMSAQDLIAAWMYQQSKGMVELCGKKIEEIDTQLKEDEEEIAEILKQIPELNVSPVVQEVINIINEQN